MIGTRKANRALGKPIAITAAAVFFLFGLVSLPAVAHQGDRPGVRSSASGKVEKCRKIKDAAKRRECILAAKGKTVTVLVEDNYYSPADLSIRPYDTVLWNWKDSTSSEGHDVGLQSGPAGVSFREFLSRVYTGPTGRFKRTFKKPGVYSFICSLHYEMQMQVAVRK